VPGSFCINIRDISFIILKFNFSENRGGGGGGGYLAYPSCTTLCQFTCFQICIGVDAVVVGGGSGVVVIIIIIIIIKIVNFTYSERGSVVG
jgi:hypothetical protein